MKEWIWYHIFGVSMQQKWLTLPSGITVRARGGERYVIEGLLGKGEMGAVYLVRDRNSMKNLYALKEVINPDQQDRERFTFEGEILKQLNHHALPHVYRVFENDRLKRVYILMDYIKGRNLEDLRAEEPASRFSLPLVLALMIPIVDALSYLHHQDPPIVHRDIKPANVIVPVGADEAMLVDFGSAKFMQAGIATVASRHTPGYAAPEQYGSGTSPRTDVYGLGATIYTLVTGTIPLDAPTRIVRTWDNRSNLLKPPDILVSTIPKAIGQTLMRAMSINSADRFETVEEFWQTLNALAAPTHERVQIPHVAIEDVRLPLYVSDAEQTSNQFAQEQIPASLVGQPAIIFLAFCEFLVLIALIIYIFF